MKIARKDKIVDELLMKSFGSNVTGKLSIRNTPFGDLVEEGESLEYIAKRPSILRKILDAVFFIGDWEIYGKFEGSPKRITLYNKRYEDAARKYATLYEESLGKEVTILLDY